VMLVAATSAPRSLAARLHSTTAASHVALRNCHHRAARMERPDLTLVVERMTANPITPKASKTSKELEAALIKALRAHLECSEGRGETRAQVAWCMSMYETGQRKSPARLASGLFAITLGWT
jgi:hypothetical protein